MEAVSVHLAQPGPAPPPPPLTHLAEGLSSPASDNSEGSSVKLSPTSIDPPALPEPVAVPGTSTITVPQSLQSDEPQTSQPQAAKPEKSPVKDEKIKSSTSPSPALVTTKTPEKKQPSPALRTPTKEVPSTITAISSPPPALVRGGKGVSFAKTAPSPSKPKTPRAPRKKIPLAVYQSEISDNKIGIKLCIKKSVDVVVAKTKKVVRRMTGKPAAASAGGSASPGGSGATGKKRSRKRKALDDSDSDEMNYRRRRRRDNNNETAISNKNNNQLLPLESTSSTSSRGTARKEVTFVAGDEPRVPRVSAAADAVIDIDQSCWALTLPENVLSHIFRYVTATEGCLPTIVRLGSVSSLWRRVAQQPSLWHTMDLTTWVKERHRNELKLKWFILNRLSGCTDLNLASWKVMNVQCVMDLLAENCPKLSGLILSGWKSLMSDHLMFIATEMKNLQRIDLSAINTEVNANKTAVGLQSLSNAVQAMGERLRHLHLANNRLGGLPQLINSLAVSTRNPLIYFTM